MRSSTESTEAQKKSEVKEQKNKKKEIHNTMSDRGPEISIKKKVESIDDDDDWNAIPAFLRRSKK